MAKKDVGCPETKKDLLRKVKSAISSTAERFSGNTQNVRSPSTAVHSCYGAGKVPLVCSCQINVFSHVLMGNYIYLALHWSCQVLLLCFKVICRPMGKLLPVTQTLVSHLWTVLGDTLVSRLVHFLFKVHVVVVMFLYSHSGLAAVDSSSQRNTTYGRTLYWKLYFRIETIFIVTDNSC